MNPQDGQLTGQQATMNALNSISLNFGGVDDALVKMGLGQPAPEGDGTIGPSGRQAVQTLEVAGVPLLNQFLGLLQAAKDAVASGQ